MLSRAEIERQSRLPNLLANTKADNRYCVQLRKNRNIPNLRKECISQLKDVDTKGNPYKSKRLWGDCCKELVLSGHATPTNLKKFEKSVMNTSPVPTAKITSTVNLPSTTTPYPRVNLHKMRNIEAEREGMERQRREMERQRQEMERRRLEMERHQQIQRNTDINKLEEAFRTLTLPTNNEFNQLIVKDQLLSLLGKLESGHKTLTPNNRRYIREVINSSKPKKGLLGKIKKGIKFRGGGLTKKKSTTLKRKLNTRKSKSTIHKRKLNTRKRKSITNKRRLNTRKSKSITNKRRLNTRKSKSTIHKMK